MINTETYQTLSEVRPVTPDEWESIRGLYYLSLWDEGSGASQNRFDEFLEQSDWVAQDYTAQNDFHGSQSWGTKFWAPEFPMLRFQRGGEYKFLQYMSDEAQEELYLTSPDVLTIERRRDAKDHRPGIGF